MKKSRAIAVATLLIIFGVLTLLTYTGTFVELETNVYRWLAGFMNPEMDKLMIGVTNIGSFTAIATAMVIFLALPGTRTKIGEPMLLCMVSAAALNLALKHIIARPRPDILRLIVEKGYGFPSGHAMNNAAFYAMLLLIVFTYSKNIRLHIVAIVFACAVPFLVGTSRVYLGVHSLGDVLAGWVVGVAVALCVDAAWKYFKKDKAKAIG